MNNVVNFLNESPVQYFATIGQDGKPKVRPFQFMFEDEGKLWFCTNNNKVVYNEMQVNPYVEFCVSNPGFEWIRLSGKAVFKNDLNVKSKCIQTSPLVRNIYQTPENPIFEVFYLEEVKAVIADFSGNPPREYNL